MWQRPNIILPYLSVVFLLRIDNNFSGHMGPVMCLWGGPHGHAANSSPWDVGRHVPCASSGPGLRSNVRSQIVKCTGYQLLSASSQVTLVTHCVRTEMSPVGNFLFAAVMRPVYRGLEGPWGRRRFRCASLDRLLKCTLLFYCQALELWVDSRALGSYSAGSFSPEFCCTL